MRDESIRSAGMKLHRRLGVLLVATLLGANVAAIGTLAGGRLAHAAPSGDDVVAFVVRGVGNGHGRGLSQWGAYGRAVNGGQQWDDILDTYYQGTRSGSIAPGRTIAVKLNALDGVGTVGVLSTISAARWRRSGDSWSPNVGSIYVDDVGSNRFDVYTGAGASCSTSVPDGPLALGDQGDDVRRIQSFLLADGYSPGPVDGEFGLMTDAAVRAFQADAGLTADGRWEIAEAQVARQRIGSGGAGSWTKVATAVTGPIEFSTSGAPANPGQALGLCQPNGSVVHYRGVVRVFDTPAAGNRTVNEVAVEDYLRGVVPKEVAASWGDDNGFAGMNALRAQAVAARSYGVSQNRAYWVDSAKTQRYATTCDSPSCQVYGGASKRTFPASTVHTPVEHALTDDAVADTAGVVRMWPDGSVVSTEFSASNGPRTAGGSFPPVDDPFDDVGANPYHRWTRIIDADSIRSRYGLSSASGVATVADADSPYSGIWANEVRLTNGATVSAWDFRNAYGLPAPGFELIPIRRTVSAAGSFAFVGDSVGSGVVQCCGAWFRELTEGVFATQWLDAVSGRQTQGGSGVDGVAAARTVPIGTDLVVVQLGYNDDPAAMSTRIDRVMSALRARDVGRVAWVNLSERSTARSYTVTNAALDAASGRWAELQVLDWDAASGPSVRNADRWFTSDGVHLTTTGNAEFSLWLRDQVIGLLGKGVVAPRPLVPGVPLRVPVAGIAGVPAEGVAGVSLNVTAVGPVGRGWLRAWPCGAVEPRTASVNYPAGGVVPNAVVIPVDDTGEVCVSSRVATDVVVDLMGWFDSGLRPAMGRLVDTRASRRVVPGVPLRVPVAGIAGVPAEGVAGVSLNVTAVGPVGRGWLRAWPCGGVEPRTASVNYPAGGVVSNAVVIPVDDTGEVCVSSRVATDVVVDLMGWFDSGLRPAMGRLVDTRASRRVVPGVPLRVPVAGIAGVPAEGVAGVSLNVTAVGPVGRGWLRAWPCGGVEPRTASVNYPAGGVVSNAVVIPVDDTGEVCVSSLTRTDVVVDLMGWFDSGLQHVPPDRLVDTRIGIGPVPGR